MSIFDRALLEAVLLGAACGPLGLWVLTYRQAYAAESLAHAMLPGLAVGAIAGLPLLLGAAGGIVAAAVLIALAARDRRIGADLAIAVTITAVFGAGILLASGVGGTGSPPKLTDLLFGDLLGVTDADLVAAAILAVLTPLVLAAGHRSLTVAAHDPETAKALGTSPARAQTLLLVLLAVAIVVAVQGLGNLLVVALLIAPGVAASRLGGGLVRQVLTAGVLGATSGAVGLVVSDELSLAAGASVALTASVIGLTVVSVRGGAAGVRRSPIEALGSRG